jgi:hypothetical protein
MEMLALNEEQANLGRPSWPDRRKLNEDQKKEKEESPKTSQVYSHRIVTPDKIYPSPWEFLRKEEEGVDFSEIIKLNCYRNIVLLPGTTDFPTHGD